MNVELEHKLAALRAGLGQMEHVIVAFSGGVDSAVLLHAAVAAVGPERVTALTAISESYPPWELAEARALAAQIGAPMREVETHEMARPGYRANTGDRCYHCKAELFDMASLQVEIQGGGTLCYGAIPDDLGDHRPGMRAADERAVRAPLIEVGLSKAEIREAARRAGLPVWDKPAAACLSSRFPYGTEITPERLARVTHCEAGLHALGLRQFRARFHGDLVRIEVAPDELEGLFADAARRAAVIQAAKAAGFKYVALDLEGYRTGSANEALVQIAPRRRSASPQ